MKLTERQGWLLKHLDNIVYRQKVSGMHGFFLNKEECTVTVNSLIVKGLVRADSGRTQLKRTELALDMR
ncbi:hypothetical protein P7D22_04965 [Lichenihabitans sp. Uapishka_5]|uniref:hypothetical protein n=1 Tax=Lichenihabitans sp. Uapishka_5 TaxID=3037302 RepID=UPI0029E800ED|nr:hypothetical protein [Lichenihabitans sp. Uapishka_5]MDX7950528.1 hypothetical protein [Lichenihabitans sp. Uapishka_5]